MGPFSEAGLLCTLASAAEAAGWDGFFVWDHLLYRGGWPVIDPWVMLSAIAARTGRLRLGLLVAGLARQHPWEVAKRAASIDHLSGGRFILGAGLGSLAEEYTAFGQSAEDRHRASRLDEALEVLTGLWSGEPVSFRGEHFTVSAPGMSPKPIQRPRIPIWVGGRWPHRPPFRRAARWDGVFPTHVSSGRGETMTPGELRQVIEFVGEERKSDQSFDVALEGQSSEDKNAARDTVAPYRDAGLTWWVEALGWWRGDASAARARVEAGPPGNR